MRKTALLFCYANICTVSKETKGKAIYKQTPHFCRHFSGVLWPAFLLQMQLHAVAACCHKTRHFCIRRHLVRVCHKCIALPSWWYHVGLFAQKEHAIVFSFQTAQAIIFGNIQPGGVFAFCRYIIYHSVYTVIKKKTSPISHVLRRYIPIPSSDVARPHHPGPPGTHWTPGGRWWQHTYHTQMLHGTGIFTYTYLKVKPNVDIP